MSVEIATRGAVEGIVKALHLSDESSLAGILETLGSSSVADTIINEVFARVHAKMDLACAHTILTDLVWKAQDLLKEGKIEQGFFQRVVDIAYQDVPTEEPVEIVSFGIIPIFKVQNRFSVMFVKQSERAVWGFPKGKPALGESPEETAVRELREETALEAELIGGIDPFRVPMNVPGRVFGRQFSKCIVCFPAFVRGEPMLDHKELKEYVVVSLSLKGLRNSRLNGYKPWKGYFRSLIKKIRG